MRRVFSGLLTGVVAGAVLTHTLAPQIEASRAASPAYLRSNLAVCAPSPSGMRCQTDYAESALSRGQTHKATVRVSVYARSPQGATTSPLDKTPHKPRLVMAGSYYATDAPATLVRTRTITIRGQQTWKLANLLPSPAKSQRPYDIYYLSISVNGWPTLHVNAVRVTP